MTATWRLLATGAAMLLLASCSGTSSAPSPQISPRSVSSVAPSPITEPTTSPAPEPTPRPTATKPKVPAGPAPPPLVVHIRDFAYLPAAPVVVVGQQIEIINDDTAAHTWSAAPDGGWKYTSGNLEKGSRATFPGFAKPGRYKFLCYYHAEMPPMTGVVTVRPAP